MSFPKYPAYKDSGVEWIGKIPAGWGVAPLFSISTENRDKNTGLKSSNTLSLSYGNIIERDKNNNFGLLPDSYETYQIVKFGDIIFRLTDLQNDRNSLRSAISRYNGIITSAYLSIKTAKNCCPFYISYLMRAYDCEKVFYSMGGGVRQSLNFKEFKYLPVILPPLPEQQAIASFLDRECGKIDALIAEQERLIALLAEKRQAVISHAVTKGLNPNAPMKDSGIPWIGMVPEGWEVMPLYLLFRLGRGRVISHEEIHENGGEYPVYSSQTEDDGVMGYINSFDFEGDYITWTTDGANAGTLFVRSGRFNCTNVCGTLFASKILNLYFVKEAISLSVKYFVRQDINPKLMNNVMSKIRISLPTYAEQNRISEMIAVIDEKYSNISKKMRKQITLLKERRAALISAAVTGKIDVRAQSKALAA